jgi:hypothetical protein
MQLAINDYGDGSHHGDGDNGFGAGFLYYTEFVFITKGYSEGIEPGNYCISIHFNGNNFYFKEYKSESIIKFHREILCS